VATLSQMPLFGAVSVAQFESWDKNEEQYQLAVVVLWSSKMERISRAIVTGEKFQVPPGEQSLRSWIRSQDWSTSTGGRRFRDNKGDVYFIGIAASPIGSSSSSEKRARGVSAQMAKKETAMAIFADVTSYKLAEQMMQTRNSGAGKDASYAAESFASSLQQSIKNRQINGLQKLYGKKLIHPISQQKIYVSIYGVSSNSAKQALEMQEKNYLTRILDIKSQQKMRGRTDAYRSKTQEAQSNKREYNKSKSTTSKRIDGSIAKEQSTQKSTSTSNGNERSTGGGYNSQDSKKGGNSRSGGYAGGGNGKLKNW